MLLAGASVSLGRVLAGSVVEAEGLGGCWAAGAKVLGRSVPTWHRVEGGGLWGALPDVVEVVF